MQKPSNRTLIILLVIVVIGYLFFVNTTDDEVNNEGVTITSFAECVEAGYPVLQTDPESCETPDGERFARDDYDEDGDQEDIVPQRTVNLYYYDAERDVDAEGNVMCSAAGLVSVERSIPMTQSPLQDSVQLLLLGELTDEEVEQGLTTEYPLEGFALTGVSRDEDDVLVLNFADSNNATTGGSCRVGILWAQIEATATQFDGFDEVRFAPDTLFQP